MEINKHLNVYGILRTGVSSHLKLEVSSAAQFIALFAAVPTLFRRTTDFVEPLFEIILVILTAKMEFTEANGEERTGNTYRLRAG